jgi:hypothetical protein
MHHKITSIATPNIAPFIKKLDLTDLANLETAYFPQASQFIGHTINLLSRFPNIKEIVFVDVIYQDPLTRVSGISQRESFSEELRSFILSSFKLLSIATKTEVIEVPEESQRIQEYKSFDIYEVEIFGREITFTIISANPLDLPTPPIKTPAFHVATWDTRNIDQNSQLFPKLIKEMEIGDILLIQNSQHLFPKHSSYNLGLEPVDISDHIDGEWTTFRKIAYRPLALIKATYEVNQPLQNTIPPELKRYTKTLLTASGLSEAIDDSIALGKKFTLPYRTGPIWGIDRLINQQFVMQFEAEAVPDKKTTMIYNDPQTKTVNTFSEKFGGMYYVAGELDIPTLFPFLNRFRQISTIQVNDLRIDHRLEDILKFYFLFENKPILRDLEHGRELSVDLNYLQLKPFKFSYTEGDLFHTTPNRPADTKPLIHVLKKPGYDMGALSGDERFYPHVIGNMVVGDLLFIRDAFLPVNNPTNLKKMGLTLLDSNLYGMSKPKQMLRPNTCCSKDQCPTDIYSWTYANDGWIILLKEEEQTASEIHELWLKDHDRAAQYPDLQLPKRGQLTTWS